MAILDFFVSQLRTSLNGHCCYKEVAILENKSRSQCIDCHLGQKKMAVVERWPFVEAQLVKYKK